MWGTSCAWGLGGTKSPEAEAILDFYMHNFDLILNFSPTPNSGGTCPSGGRVPPSSKVYACSHELSITVDEVVSTGKSQRFDLEGISDSDSENSTNTIYEYIQLNRNQHTRKQGRI